MKILLVIIFVLFLLYVGGMMYALCYIAGEAEEADREYLERIEKERYGGENQSDNQTTGRTDGTHDLDQ